ncbi:MAG: GTP 3',8-cyclase MoaA [Actinobacteria bacterium]|nr:GTP 3',8-cyclase MoaA [Actinomycetota bacterium]MBW3650633.1 GTP 3',8-cyclase MoaA [Actinomycetota bacterium]
MVVTTALVDNYDRVVRDLRISVTDRCNFRCTYCMPAEGMDWLARSEILSFEEIERVARVCVERFGFTSIRLTGGEPTVRADLAVLVERLAALGTDLSMTTNGATLALLAPDLRRAGLQRINVSLDSLRRDRFLALTKRDRLAEVLEGIDAALAAGLAPVKVNCVLMRGVNDDEIVDFASFGRDRGVGIRFIEYMPLDAQGAWRPGSVVSAEEIIATIDSVFELAPVERRGHQPAERFRYRDGRGEVGVIASVTRPFCGDCDRVRLTAEGAFRNCLFAARETDLRAVLRSGGTDDDLEEAIRSDVAGKWAGHAIGQVTFVKPPRSMSQIGG